MINHIERNQCEFQTHYTNFQGETKLYCCKEPSLTEKILCIFHDENFIKQPENAEKIINAFQYKLKTLNANKEDLIFIGYHLPDLEIFDLCLVKDVYFNDTVFHGKFSCNKVTFNNASFSNIQVHSDDAIVNFSNCLFFGNVEFKNSEISVEKIYFTSTEFLGNQTDFSNTKFIGINEIDFSNSKFYSQSTRFNNSEFNSKNNGIYFTICKLSGQVYFDGCKFSGKQLIFFAGIKFSGNLVSFGNAEFHGRGVTFTRAEFSNSKAYVGFINTLFHCDEVSFSKSKFLGKVEFTRSEFIVKRSSDFNDSIFLQRCDFSEVIFSGGQLFFLKTEFSDDVFFKKTQFSEVQFNETNFKKTCNFSHSKFLDVTNFINSKFNDIIFFNHVICEHPEKVIFQIKNLSNISLINTDVTKILFVGNPIFGIKSNERFKIYDDRIFENSKKSVGQDNNLEDIISLYRNLRENYEYQMRYEEAGQFFIREMELKRLYKYDTSNNRIKETNILEKNFSLLGLYYHTSRYGEDYGRPLILLGLIILTSTLYWWMFHTYFPDASIISEGGGKIKILECNEEHISICSLKRTFTNIIVFSENAQLVDYITKIAIIIVLGILFLGLRRKFERRFRH